jgi:MOSC domain-containing protein YiiM
VPLLLFLVLRSVNVGLPQPLATPKGEVLSGILKRPVAGRVRVRRLGLEGDGQADLTVHGGLGKAVYAYSHDHYLPWMRELGRGDLPPGFFGENLTVDGMLESDVRIGDIYRIGTAVLQATQPRSPCFKLAARLGLPDFARIFLASGRSGFYLRVLEEGDVGAGDTIERISSPPAGLSVLEDLRRRTAAQGVPPE